MMILHAQGACLSANIGVASHMLFVFMLHYQWVYIFKQKL